MPSVFCKTSQRVSRVFVFVQVIKPFHCPSVIFIRLSSQPVECVLRTSQSLSGNQWQVPHTPRSSVQCPESCGLRRTMVQIHTAIQQEPMDTEILDQILRIPFQ